VLEVTDNLVQRNRSVGTEARPADNAFSVAPQRASEFTIARNRVVDNVGVAGPYPFPANRAGFAVTASAASGTVTDNVVAGNLALGSGGSCRLLLHARSVERGSHVTTAERNLVARNRCNVSLEVTPAEDSVIVVRDTAMSSENGWALVYPDTEARVDLVNVTLVSGIPLDPRLGTIQAVGPGTLRLSNSVVVGARPIDESQFTGTLQAGTNLLTQDAKLVAPFAGDLRPLAGSPALNAGSASPLGGVGLGATDLEGKPRVAGPKVDLGAYERGPGPCIADAETLCLAGGRFAVDTYWRRPDGQRGTGQAVPLSADTGYLWFFSPANVEMLLKVLDACPVNNRFWVFAGGLTNVEVDMAVTDSASGAIKVYRNPRNTNFKAIQDTGAFQGCGGAPAAARGVTGPAPRAATTAAHGTTGPPQGVAFSPATALCATDDLRFCAGGRFLVSARWRLASGETGDAHAVPLTADTGAFWFFSASNLEVVTKVLDACALNSRRWVFATGLTNVRAELTVLDTVTGETWDHVNPVSTPFAPIFDTDALEGC
jgi:hypothetical protein